MGGETENKNGEGDDRLEDDMMDKISSSPSIEDATTEGQANASKGDTMVLLDDSNSYWWLVRVVKDSSIGYLPAEHIETPTERLARLNKHRNIDPERHKSTIIKAFRKRGTKTVAFTDPTYFEASDIDYSSEDEEDLEYSNHMILRDQNSEHQENIYEEDEETSLEPSRAEQEEKETEVDMLDQESSSTDHTSDNSKINDELSDEGSEIKSRNEVLKNTDSIFPDDSVETRKITLTPNLLREIPSQLRDDTDSSTLEVSDDLREHRRPSQDKFEKDSPEKGKDKKERRDKKERDKKSGMLSGLFKRRDRKNKSIDEAVDEILGSRQSNDLAQLSPVLSKDSDITVEEQSIQPQDIPTHLGKSLKEPRPENLVAQNAVQSTEPKTVEQNGETEERSTPNAILSDSTHQIESDIALEEVRELNQHLDTENDASGKKIASENKNTQTYRTEGHIDSIPIKLKQAKSPVELDDFGTLKDATIYPSTRLDEISSPLQNNTSNRLQPQPSNLMRDNLSQENLPSSESSASTESINVENTFTKVKAENSSNLTNIWSDSHLKTFFDNDNEIKDLLIIIYDNSEVIPAGPQHPVTGSLFKEESGKLADVSNRLDGILENWLARKSRTLSGR